MPQKDSPPEEPARGAQFWTSPTRIVTPSLGQIIRLLYLFSGLAGKTTGIEAAAAQVSLELGCVIQVDMVDKLNSSLADLLDEDCAEWYLNGIESGYYDAGLGSPPCETYSMARERPGGPPPLRGAEGPDLYGLPNLKPAQKESARKGTLLSLRGIEMGKRFHARSRPWLIENPARVEGKPSMFCLDEAVSLMESSGAIVNNIRQCIYRADCEKPTFFVGSVTLDHSGAECPHPPRWWKQPPSGWEFQAPHAPLYGRRRAVPWEDWDEAVHTLPTDPVLHPFVTKDAAAYPWDLNVELVRKLVAPVLKLHQDVEAMEEAPPPGVWTPPAEAARPPGCWDPPAPPSDAQAAAAAPPGSASTPTPTPPSPSLPSASAAPVSFGPPISEQGVHDPHGLEWSHALRGRAALPTTKKQRREAKDSQFIGGLRRTAAAAARNPAARNLGLQVREALVAELQQHDDLFRACTDAIGSQDPEAGPSQAHLHRVRRVLAKIVDCADPDPLDPTTHNSEIAGGLLECWAAAAGDPDLEAASWPRHGAPAGILEHPTQVGVFPEAVEDSGIRDPLTTEFDAPATRHSYESVEECPHALAEVERLTSLGFLKRCETEQELEEVCGEGPKVISKFGQVVKEKDGITKRRTILDAKESGVTACARKNQRIVLPSVNDLVFDALDLLATKADVEALVLDVTDAFWSLGLRRRERRFFIGKLRGVFYAFLRLAQGSRGAPLVWCRFFALVTRLTQALFESTDVRFNTYVDDPVAALAGTPARRDLATATVVLLWRLLNLKLAFRKGQRGPEIDWIGFHVAISAMRSAEQVVVSVKPETAKGILDLIGQFWVRNMLRVKEVRSFAGKVANVARLILGWRPFLFELWGALSAAEEARSRRVWTKQIRPALAWFRAFLHSESIGMQRTFRLVSYKGHADTICITLDASPFGMGAYISRDRVPLEWFAIAVSEDDMRILGYDTGDSAGQQAWECLCGLICLRIWAHFWLEDRTALRVRGDNGALLAMVADFKTSGPGTNVVGRELALVMARGCYKPTVASHLPGIANVISDLLSRRFQDKYSQDWSPHPFLDGAVEVFPERRCESWYETLVPPGAGPRKAKWGPWGRHQPRRKRQARK